MSTKIIDLEDRIITDGGEVVFKYDFFTEKAMFGEVFTGYKAIPNDDINLYNKKKGIDRPDAVKLWEDDGKWCGPSEDTFEWIIPEEFQTLNLVELATERLVELNLTTEEYQERLAYELDEMDKRGMFQFVRCVLYVIDRFKRNGIIWGVGRGSSCASLVLFVLNINRVDPVKYQIPIEEFLK